MSSPAAPPAGAVPFALPVIPALDNSFGALYVGVVVGAAIWGIGTAQLYWYYTNYPKDELTLKLFVALVWSIDTVHQILCSHVVYVYLVTNYFNPLFLDHYLWSLDLQSLFEALTSVTVQCFFLFRIWRLSEHNYFLTGIASSLVFAKFGLGLAYVIEGFTINSITVAFAKQHGQSEAINGLAAASDVVIAALMCWLLYNSRTGFKRTDTLITRLMMYTINTGLLTSFAAVLSLITAVSLPKAFVYGAFYFLIGRLYVNSMLATLNTRKSLADIGNEIVLSSTKGNSGRPAMSHSTKFPGSTPDRQDTDEFTISQSFPKDLESLP